MKSLFLFISLLVSASLAEQQPEADYTQMSQMFMVCSPVYSRSELQRILETSIHSLAFQVPINPMQKLKKDFLSQPPISRSPLNSGLNMPANGKIQQNQPDLNVATSSNVQSRPDLNVPINSVQNSQYESQDAKFTATSSSTVREPEEPTTYLPSTSTEPSTVQSTTSSTAMPASSSTTTKASTTTTTSTSTTTTTTTTPVPTTMIYSTTTSSTTASPTTTTAKSSRAIRPSNKRFYSNYYKNQHYKPFIPITTSTTTTAASVSSTSTNTPIDLPSIEVNTKPSLAKIRSRLFHLFQPRQYNSNVLHKPRPVDYPTLSPQSLFANNNAQQILKQQHQQQQSTTSTTTTARPSTIESNKLIYSSTESYPQIQSSISPADLKAASFQSTTTTTTTLDGLLQSAKEDKQKYIAQFNHLNNLNMNDKSRQTPTNDNLLAVASSPRFHSVLNSVLNSNGEEKKEVELAEEKKNDKVEDSAKESNALVGRSKDSDLKSSNSAAATESISAAITGPLKLEEIFSDFDESKNDTSTEKVNESNAATTEKVDLIKNDPIDKSSSKDQSTNSKIEFDDSKSQTNASSDQVLYTSSDNNSPTESSTIVIDENDGLIVKKLSDVVEIVNENVEGDHSSDVEPAVNRQDAPQQASKGQSDEDKKSMDKSSTDSVDKTSNDKSKSADKSNVDKSNVDKSNEFIEIPASGSAIDKFTEDKSGDRLTSNDKSPKDEMKTTENNKAQDKPIDNPFEMGDRLIEDKSIATTVYDDISTTTSRPANDDQSNLNTYTYPIEFMV